MALTIPSVFTAIDKFSAPVRKMSSNVSQFANKTEAFTARSNRAFRKMTPSVGNFGTVLGGIGLASIIHSGTTAVVEFDKAVTSASAKFGFEQGSEGFNKLSQAAQEVGATTEFTAGQAAQGLDFLAMAGFNAEQSIASLPSVVNLATASSTGLAEATDLASDSLGAFNMMTKDSEKLQANLSRINNVLAKTSTTANTTITAMFEAIKEGAPIATASGASVETFAALTGVLANAGIKGSTAGTTLKNMFISLQKQTPAASEALNSMGVKTVDSQGNMLDMIDIIGQLNKATAGMGTAERTSRLGDIFGKIPIAGVNVLLNEGAESLNAYRESLINSEGAADRMAKIMRGGLSGAISAMMSSIESISITIGETFKSDITSAIISIQDFARSVNTFIKENKGLITFLVSAMKWVVSGFLLWKTSIIATNAVLFIHKAAMVAVTAAQWLWNAAMAANPIGLIIAGVVILVGVIALLIAKWDSWGAAVSTVFAFFMPQLMLVISLVMAFRRNWDMIVDAFKNKGILSGLLAIGATILDAILMPLQQVFGLLSKVPGLGFTGGIAASIQGIRENIGVETAPVVSADQARQENIQRSISESNSTLNINNNTGFDAYLESENSNVPIKLTPTFGF